MTWQSAPLGPPLPPEKQNVLPMKVEGSPSASGTCEPEGGRIGLTLSAAHVDRGAVGALALGDDAVRRDVRGVVAARGHELDVVVLADEALVCDGLAGALGGASGADESRVRGGEEGSGDGDQSEELHDGKGGCK